MKTEAKKVAMGERIWVSGMVSYPGYYQVNSWSKSLTAGETSEKLERCGDQLWLTALGISLPASADQRHAPRYALGDVLDIAGWGQFELVRGSDYHHPELKPVNAKAKAAWAKHLASLKAETAERVANCEADRKNPGHYCMNCRPDYCMA